MDSRYLDKRFLIFTMDQTLADVWHIITAHPRRILYVCVNTSSGYIFITQQELSTLLESIGAAGHSTRKIGELLHGYSLEPVFEISQYSYEESKSLLQDAEKRRVLFVNHGIPVGFLYDVATNVAATNGLEVAISTDYEMRRHVNIWLSLPDSGDIALNRTNNLIPGAKYNIVLNIGPFNYASVVENPTIFPTDMLPQSIDGHMLEVAISSGSFLIEKYIFPLFLPLNGATTDLLLPVSAPTEAGKADLAICIYYKNTLLQVLKLTAWVGTVNNRPSGYRAQIIFSLTSGMVSVDRMPYRDASFSTLALQDDKPFLLVMGKNNQFTQMLIDESKMNEAITGARLGLEKVHFKVYGGGLLSAPQKENLLNTDNGKKLKEFLEDMRFLALFGYRLYGALSNGQEKKQALKDILQYGPAKIQIAHALGSQIIFPWALVYDIPLESNPDDYHLCKLLEEWDSHHDLLTSEDLFDCPYSDRHKINTLCPFGFWGIRHTIEQPHSVPPGGELHLWIQPIKRPYKMVIGLSTSLDKRITDSHLIKIKDSLNNCFASNCDTREKLRNDLTINDLEFVYFYCHGRHDTTGQPGGIRSSVTYLEIGRNDRITTEDLNAWSEAYWDPKLHWRSVAPLVFINGCHTSDITPNGLGSLVEVFNDNCAAGVIGTEISVDQKLAAEVAETFFYYLSMNCTVGESLRAMRFQLLSKGNLLGLAYTPYCSTDLRIQRAI